MFSRQLLDARNECAAVAFAAELITGTGAGAESVYRGVIPADMYN